MSNRSETFGRLLKGAINSIATYEGKTAPTIEEELAQQVGLAGSSYQRYKTGYLPPEPRTIEIIAEAAVRRGYLNRDWLQRFLHAARYHQADRLLDQLCPIGPARPQPPRVYHNLPVPTYSQFVMRQKAFAEVTDGLGKRTAAVLVVGMGGNGKTSLVREVADACLRDAAAAPRFEAAVWVSDKDRPGTTNLSTVLDEIARTLDYPGFTQFEFDEKRREVELLLRRQRVLLVVDNFETITDGALLTWLLNLPEPSKTLITSREYRREWRSSWPVELRGMSEGEIRTLIDQRLRQLQIERPVGSLDQLEPLIAATGGNPKAIEITLGLVKHERRPLQQVVDDLYAARGELFDDLFARAWALLNEAARRVLMIATFFPTSASGEALSASADVQGFSFDRAVEQLMDLALLDVQQADLMSSARYTLHPLVRIFAQARVKEHRAFENDARSRWVQWYIHHAAAVGYCWNDLQKLDNLDTEADMLHIVITWCFHNNYFVETLQIVRDVFFYYHVRGLWYHQPSIYLMAAKAAMHQSNAIEQIRYLALQVKYLNWQDNWMDADALVAQLVKLEQTVVLPTDVLMLYRQSLALYYLVRQDIDTAQQLLQEAVVLGEAVEDKQSCNANKHWLAACLYQKGMLEEAKKLLEEALKDASLWNVQRGTFAHPRWLIAIYLDQNDLDAAGALLVQVTPRVHQFKDRRYMALLQRLYARFHTLRGNLQAARAALEDAIDLFERLGMRRELAEARAELARLDELGRASVA
jgi:hypothetical protein